jgi:hypothetical protein
MAICMLFIGVFSSFKQDLKQTLPLSWDPTDTGTGSFDETLVTAQV